MKDLKIETFTNQSDDESSEAEFNNSGYITFPAQRPSYTPSLTIFNGFTKIIDEGDDDPEIEEVNIDDGTLEIRKLINVNKINITKGTLKFDELVNPELFPQINLIGQANEAIIEVTPEPDLFK